MNNTESASELMRDAESEGGVTIKGRKTRKAKRHKSDGIVTLLVQRRGNWSKKEVRRGKKRSVDFP